MSSADWFATSSVGWFRTRADEVLQEIAHQLDPEPPTPGHIFRPDRVNNATTQRIVPTAAERLVRWDRRAPSEIFQRGFEPRVAPPNQTFPEAAFHLRNYVLNNIPSVFVSTTRYYRNNTDALRRWRQQRISQRGTYYEYEIFAYGGIDVNDALGSHRYESQHEIAFPGGILPRFIRSVRVYEGANPIRIEQNPRFNNEANPTIHIVPLVDLPGPVIMNGLQIEYYPPENEDSASEAAPHGDGELRRRRRDVDGAEYDASEDWDDLMRGEGESVEDSLIDKALSRPCVAAVLHPSDSGRAYFFCWNKYVAINIAAGSTGDTIAWGPKTLIGNWPSLVKANFGYVDAALPSPSKKNEMYFFFREKYALVNIKPGTTDDFIINGPKPILSEWPSLRKAGFNTVDAVLPSPADSNETYFFSGERYVLVYFEPGRVDDYIVNGPKSIITEWPSLRKAGFKTVDTILPHPDNKHQAYVFSGDQYVLIYFKPGAVDDYIVNGPKLVRTEWPSLHQAEFW